MRLDEIAVRQIVAKTKQAFPNTGRELARVSTNITHLLYDVYQPNQMIKCEADVMSNGMEYSSIIEFSEVQFVEEETTPGASVEVVGTNFRKYQIRPLSMEGNNAHVRCSCPDFIYRFAFYDYQRDCLYGPLPPKYVRKTQRPPVNPTKSIGMCKHLHAVVERLKREGVIG